MSTQIQSQCAIPLIREEVEEVFIPAPRRVTGPVNEEQRHGMRLGGRPLVDHFKHRSVPSIKIAPEMVSDAMTAFAAFAHRHPSQRDDRSVTIGI